MRVSSKEETRRRLEKHGGTGHRKEPEILWPATAKGENERKERRYGVKKRRGGSTLWEK